jgi:hypothetical protein
MRTPSGSDLTFPPPCGPVWAGDIANRCARTSRIVLRVLREGVGTLFGDNSAMEKKLESKRHYRETVEPFPLRHRRCRPPRSAALSPAAPYACARLAPASPSHWPGCNRRRLRRLVQTSENGNHGLQCPLSIEWQLFVMSPNACSRCLRSKGVGRSLKAGKN